MGTYTVATTVRIKTVECCLCGILFGLAEAYYDERLGDKRTWYCPNGHTQSFMGKTWQEQVEEQKRLRMVAQADADRARDVADRAIRREAKLKKRITAGVCPHCHRTFKQVTAHMARQHPEEVAKA